MPNYQLWTNYWPHFIKKAICYVLMTIWRAIFHLKSSLLLYIIVPTNNKWIILLSCIDFLSQVYLLEECRRWHLKNKTAILLCQDRISIINTYSRSLDIKKNKSFFRIQICAYELYFEPIEHIISILILYQDWYWI